MQWAWGVCCRTLFSHTVHLSPSHSFCIWANIRGPGGWEASLLRVLVLYAAGHSGRSRKQQAVQLPAPWPRTFSFLLCIIIFILTFWSKSSLDIGPSSPSPGNWCVTEQESFRIMGLDQGFAVKTQNPKVVPIVGNIRLEWTPPAVQVMWALDDARTYCSSGQNMTAKMVGVFFVTWVWEAHSCCGGPRGRCAHRLVPVEELETQCYFSSFLSSKANTVGRSGQFHTCALLAFPNRTTVVRELGGDLWIQSVNLLAS